jgi:hypothetical protein
MESCTPWLHSSQQVKWMLAAMKQLLMPTGVAMDIAVVVELVAIQQQVQQWLLLQLLVVMAVLALAIVPALVATVYEAVAVEVVVADKIVELQLGYLREYTS